MNGIARRDALVRLCGASLTAGCGLCAHSLFAQSPIPTSNVAIPAEPMRLSRRLLRSMRGGAELIVTRSWDVSFVRQNRGITVIGQQVSASVDAPPPLAAIAKLEEARSTDDMWPILLTDQGRIAVSANGLRPSDVEMALKEAESAIGSRDITASLKTEQMRYLKQIQRAGAGLLNQRPDDLFFPSGTPINSARSLDLPDGIKGEFELKYHAVPQGEGGWLKTATRQAITRIGDSERRAREDWALIEI